jgi:hypothetical protein
MLRFTCLTKCSWYELPQNAVLQAHVSPQWLDNHWVHSLRRSAIYLFIRLAYVSQRLPASLYIHGVEIPDRDSPRYGGFADVYLGNCQGQRVALKKLRVTEWSSERADIHRVCMESYKKRVKPLMFI